MKLYNGLLCIIFACSFSLITASENTGNASIVIFSFDRPLQLDALLKSINAFVTGVDEITILYRVSNDEYNTAYNECFSTFSHMNISYIKQGDNPRDDFKPLLMNILQSSKNDYIFLLVDDTLAISPIDVSLYITLLEKYNAYCFYLGLGKNITQSYQLHIENIIPILKEDEPDVCVWTFQDGIGEWCYPNGIDRNIFRKQQILDDFAALSFSSPNYLEAYWHILSQTNGTMQKKGLCCAQSKMINIPFNIVMLDWHTGYSAPLSSKQCLDFFNEGKRMDIFRYVGVIPRAPHIDLPMYFQESTSLQ